MTHSQTFSHTEKLVAGNAYDIFLVEITEDNLSQFGIYENTSGYTHDQLNKMASNDSVWFSINASITDASCNPLGYYCLDGVIQKEVNLSTGSGNFYLKPNGALLVTSDDVAICASDEINYFTNVIHGIQSGPLLLNNGNVHPLFNPNSTNRNIRCGVGLFERNGAQFLVFAASVRSVTFYEFALLFLDEYGCENALCLESATCSMHLPFIESSSDQSNTITCNYLYYQIRGQN